MSGNMCEFMGSKESKDQGLAHLRDVQAQADSGVLRSQSGRPSVDATGSQSQSWVANVDRVTMHQSQQEKGFRHNSIPVICAGVVTKGGKRPAKVASGQYRTDEEFARLAQDGCDGRIEEAKAVFLPSVSGVEQRTEACLQAWNTLPEGPVSSVDGPTDVVEDGPWHRCAKDGPEVPPVFSDDWGHLGEPDGWCFALASTNSEYGRWLSSAQEYLRMQANAETGSYLPKILTPADHEQV